VVLFKTTLTKIWLFSEKQHLVLLIFRLNWIFMF